MRSADLLTHLDYRFFLPLSSRLPTRWAYPLADLRGTLQCLQRQESRKRAEENVARVFPELPPGRVKEIVVQHFRVESRNQLEALWYARPRPFFEQLVKARGLKLLLNPDSRSGTLLFSGHFGSTGLFFVYTGKHGARMNIVGRSIEPHENPMHPAALAYNRERVRLIESAVGNPFLLIGRGNYRAMLAKLHNRETLMLLIDVFPSLVSRTVEITFLGESALFPEGIGNLYLETRSRMIYWNIHWDPEWRRQEITLTDVTSRVEGCATTREVVQELALILEKDIRLLPGHWLSWDSLEHFRKPAHLP
ncbi:MAG: hypothetical protein HY645_10500 [Acidobacteria bacterium]|nr:hypothetical protein [Acidobacteriota bacterium]